MGPLLATLVSATSNGDPHKGAVLPEGRVIVLAVPTLALIFYVFVVRRRRDQ